MRRQLTISEHGMIVALLLVGTALLIACTGCTPRMHMYAGQGLDLASTYDALERHDGFYEANPLADDVQGVLLLKVAGIGFIELLAHLCPEKADTLYAIGAIVGYGAGIHNIYEVNK